MTHNLWCIRIMRIIMCPTLAHNCKQCTLTSLASWLDDSKCANEIIYPMISDDGVVMTNRTLTSCWLMIGGRKSQPFRCVRRMSRFAIAAHQISDSSARKWTDRRRRVTQFIAATQSIGALLPLPFRSTVACISKWAERKSLQIRKLFAIFVEY